MINNAIPLRIASVSYSVPNTVVTNKDLTKLYDTSDEWIFSRTGIKERRMVSGDEDAVSLGIDAAQKALNKSGLRPEDIEMVIVAASAPPQLYPAVGCQIQAALNIPNNVPAFDITAACTGLIYALSIARGFIASGIYKNILIVATDNNSKLLDWSDRSCSILFGDGAGAMVVTASEDGVDDIISIDIRANGSIGEIIQFNFRQFHFLIPLLNLQQIHQQVRHLYLPDVLKLKVYIHLSMLYNKIQQMALQNLKEHRHQTFLHAELQLLLHDIWVDIHFCKLTHVLHL